MTDNNPINNIKHLIISSRARVVGRWDYNTMTRPKPYTLKCEKYIDRYLKEIQQ